MLVAFKSGYPYPPDLKTSAGDFYFLFKIGTMDNIQPNALLEDFSFSSNSLWVNLFSHPFRCTGDRGRIGIMKGFFKEFQAFINRGSVMDLAVAVVIGAAFTAIVNSLVDDIIMPFVGVLMGGVDFSELSLTIGAATIQYGHFIQSVINFIIIAFVVFLMVKSINSIQEELAPEEEEEPPPPEPTDEVKLLTEIRDLLKKD